VIGPESDVLAREKVHVLDAGVGFFRQSPQTKEAVGQFFGFSSVLRPKTVIWAGTPG